MAASVPTASAVPSPVRPMSVGLAGALLMRRSVATTLPAEPGAKVIEIVQLPDGVTGAEVHVCEVTA